MATPATVCTSTTAVGAGSCTTPSGMTANAVLWNTNYYVSYPSNKATHAKYTYYMRRVAEGSSTYGYEE